MSRDVQDCEDKKPWVEPKIDVLAIKETEALNGLGRDGGAYSASQRS